MFLNGVLAQLGEHLPYKQGVTGSSPVGPIFYLQDFCPAFFRDKPVKRSMGVVLAQKPNGAFDGQRGI